MKRAEEIARGNAAKALSENEDFVSIMKEVRERATMLLFSAEYGSDVLFEAQMWAKAEQIVLGVVQTRIDAGEIAKRKQDLDHG